MERKKLFKIILGIIAGIVILALFGNFILPLLIVLGIVFILKREKIHAHPNFQKIFNYFQQKSYADFKDVTGSKRGRFSKSVDDYKKSMEKLRGRGKYIALGIIVILLLIKSISIIDAGMTGVVSFFGKVYDREIPSGIHLINPLARVTKMSIRTEEYTMSVVQGEGVKKGPDAIDALTKEGLKVSLDITVLFHLDEKNASDVYKELGSSYSDKLIRPTIRAVIREVVADYEAKDIYSEKREEAAQKILEVLANRINKRGIVIEEVLLRNVELPQKLADSIEQKLTAEQEAQRYDFILQKESKEAERKRVEAEGQRDAQRIINESLSAEYLNYLYIQNLKDREGTIYVPTNPSTGVPLFKGIE